MMRILLVDQAPLRAAFLRRALALDAPGASVVEAPGLDPSDEALGIVVASTPIDDVVRAARAFDAPPPVLALARQEEDVARALRDGAFEAALERDLARGGTSAWGHARFSRALRRAVWCSVLQRRASASTRARADASAAGPLRVLDVDDSPAALALTRHALRGSGLEITPCGSGADATAALAAGRFDAALVDSQLPDTSGPEVAATIGRLDPLCAVVGLTSAEDVETERRFLASGALAYLGKGVGTFGAIEPVVRTSVRLARLWAGVEAEHAGAFPRIDLTRVPPA